MRTVSGMSKKIPLINTGKRILIICEGSEEEDYFKRLKECSVWSRDISVKVLNAKSIDAIIAHYQYHYQSGNYALIVVFCDTEKEPYTQFLSLRNSIDEFHGNKSAKKVVYYANPCTMQVILSHFGKIKLKNNSKTANSAIIHRLTGVEDYKATEKQRSAIMKKITAENYRTMKDNISQLSTRYDCVPSTNCKMLFDGLDGSSATWIGECNKEIEKE